MKKPIQCCVFKVRQYILLLILAANTLLKPIVDCQLSYTIGTHKAMYSVMHLFPENSVVGKNDVIPGLSDTDTSGKCAQTPSQA